MGPGTSRTLVEKWMNQVNENQTGADLTGFGQKLLDTKAVAEQLNVSESWVRDHSRRNGPEPRLPAMKFGPGKTAVVRFHPDDILAFVNAQREQGIANGSRHSGWRN